MDHLFEMLLEEHRAAVERFVRFRLPSKPDADDTLQEVYIAAYQKFAQLKNRDAFKAWLLAIARNKCNDYFRKKATEFEIPIDELTQQELSTGRCGVSHCESVRETLELLGEKDKQILYLAYWKDMPQAEIAKKLGLPIGTVKSRLHTAKQHFKSSYTRRAQPTKGECQMKKLPAYMPEYSIEPAKQPPFSVKWEELMGWFLVPKLGERLSWGMYDIPSRRCSYLYDMQVTGKARVHGIEGVELTARETDCSGKNKPVLRKFVAQLTQTHCRCLATLRNDGDVKNYITFLDGDEFLPNWGFGEDNCGNEVNLAPKGDIRRDGSVITCADKQFLLDIVGRYSVTIGGKSYDTVCVMDVETYNGGVASEQFLDKNGRTILWRRFNRDDWALQRYKKRWSEQLPKNEKLTINGQTYVHWYDCITEYIL